MLRPILIFFLLGCCLVTHAQQGNDESPFKVNKAISLGITALGAGTAVYGYTKLQDKPPVTEMELDYLVANSSDLIIRINQVCTTQYSLQSAQISDYFFYGSYPLPFLLALDKKIRGDGGKFAFMWLETLAFTGAGYFITVNLVDKFRPYAYNTLAPLETRMDNGTRNSFYGGHPTATAAASFFMAQVISAYYPDSKVKPWLYVGASALTLTNAYLRFNAGKHFLTDLGAGLVYGVGVGLLVPHFHRNRVDGLSMFPLMGKYNGMGLTYNIGGRKKPLHPVPLY